MTDSLDHSPERPAGIEPGKNWDQERFVARARALFYARMMFLTLGLLILAVPPWSEHFGLSGPLAIAGYLVMLMYSVANYTVIEHPTVGRYVTYVTLCLDLVITVILIARPQVGGGLKSPLLATQLVFTTLFAILFPRPLAVLPPLLFLLVATRLDLLLYRQVTAIELLTILWYSALNVITVYVIVYMNEQESSAQRQVLKLQADLKDLAVIEERNRLAREIHDGLGASLSSVIIQSEYLLKLASDPSLKSEINELKTAAEEAIEELRRSLRMMREDFDLLQAVSDYLKTFTDRTQLPVKLEHAGLPPKLSPEVQLAVFRVLQEALSNAARHAGAKAIEVRLRFEDHRLLLSISDDGKGFDARRSMPGHYGLVHMTERAKKIGGDVVIDASPGSGTRILLTLPT